MDSVRDASFDRHTAGMGTKSFPSGISEYRLSAEEKGEIRSCVLAFCARNPVQQRVWGTALLKALRLTPVAATIVIFTTTSIGALAYAAEETVPGDNLYGFKVGISEPVMGMFYMNADARGKWELRRMERRLLEAERLAMTTKDGDPKMREILAQHMNDQERLTQRLMDRARDFSNPEEAEEYRQQLKDMLNAHSALLRAVATRDPEGEANVVAFVERLGSIEEQTVAMQEQVAALEAPLQQAMDLQQDAQRMQNDIDRLRAVSRTPDEAEEVRSDIRQMQHELNAVEAALEAGQLTKAEELIRASRRRARELTTTIAMQSEPLPPAVESSPASDDDSPSAIMMMKAVVDDVSSVSSQTATGSSASSAKSGSAAMIEDLPL